MLIVFSLISSAAQSAFAQQAERADPKAAMRKITSVDNIDYEYCGKLAWLDDAYCYLLYGVDTTANVLNDLSRHEGGNQKSEASTRGRLRFGWEPRSGDFSELDFRFRVRVKLPALEDRVELVLSDQEDDVNQQELKAARQDQNTNNDQAVIALQFKKNEDDKVSYRVGFGRGSQLYTRARYSDKTVFSPKSTLHYFSEVNYYSSDRMGIEFSAEFGHVFNHRSAYQFNNSFRFRDRSNDWFWRHEMQVIYLGKNNTSYLATAMIDGLSTPRYRKEQMLVSFRYKRQIYREWLYLEVEPFVLWLRRENFRASMGLALRAEVHFET
ncbi:MAG: hypothetical protein WA981_02325 [Glaciecola sp.]